VSPKLEAKGGGGGEGGGGTSSFVEVCWLCGAREGVGRGCFLRGWGVEEWVMFGGWGPRCVELCGGVGVVLGGARGGGGRGEWGGGDGGGGGGAGVAPSNKRSTAKIGMSSLHSKKDFLSYISLRTQKKCGLGTSLRDLTRL